MFAATETVDLARLLLDLLIVLVAAKLAAEVAERVRLPAVLGEIVAGIVIGPSVLGLVELGGERGVSLTILAELGVLLLLLSVGMEMDLGELGKVGGAAMSVAVIGVVVPFAAGAGVGIAFGQETNTAIFIGAALTATSVGITARVFGDLRALATVEARIVLGAAVADDVLGLIILTVVVKLVTGGSVGAGTVLETLGLAVIFLLGTGLVGVYLVPRAFQAVSRRITSSATLIVAAFALMLAFAALADLANLAFIIGAFMAGLALGRTEQHDRIATDLGAVGNVLIPIFFLSIGINADLEAMADPAVIGVAAALSAVAIAGKIVAGVGVRGRRADRLLIGLGMIPRGEVGLIFAAIGLSNGVLNDDEYGALLIVILLTTVITPPLLRARLGRGAEADSDAAASTELVALALDVARRAAYDPPTPEVLERFAATRTAPVEWHRSMTPALVDLLRLDSPRSWRFLDVTGVLERALPEIDQVMRRRRADMSDLDPLGALRFPVVDRLHEIVTVDGGGAETDDLALAALVADVSDDPDEMFTLASRLVNEVEVDRVLALVADARTLRSLAQHTLILDNTEILLLATHLASAAHARDAEVLARALGELSKPQRERLDAVLDALLEALDHPELVGVESTNLAAARRIAAQHLLTEEAPIDRLRFASTTHLLAHEPEELARQARLIEPLARPGVVRVAVSPDEQPDRWRIDVASRDSAGLLARLTDVLVEMELEIERADVATWPDGGVLDSFIVHCVDRPSARDLATAMEQQLRRPLRPVDGSGLQLSFDNAALPWHTVCTVSGPDRPGVLRAITHAFAGAAVVVHSGRISSIDGEIVDRFTISDRFGRKLDERAQTRVRTELDGKPSRRSRR